MNIRPLPLVILLVLATQLCACRAEHAAAEHATSSADESPASTAQSAIPQSRVNRTPRPRLAPGWWSSAEMQTTLKLSPAQVDAFSRRLRNDELSYQLAQTEMRQARRDQAALLEAFPIDVAAVSAVHQERLQPPSQRILQINFEARLWVRQQLSPAQVRAALDYSPHFFRARWFRSARGKVQEVKMEHS